MTWGNPISLGQRIWTFRSRFHSALTYYQRPFSGNTQYKQVITRENKSQLFLVVVSKALVTEAQKEGVGISRLAFGHHLGEQQRGIKEEQVNFVLAILNMVAAWLAVAIAMLWGMLRIARRRNSSVEKRPFAHSSALRPQQKPRSISLNPSSI